jgi:hypothetical protein
LAGNGLAAGRATAQTACARGEASALPASAAPSASAAASAAPQGTGRAHALFAVACHFDLLVCPTAGLRSKSYAMSFDAFKEKEKKGYIRGL